MKTLMSLMVVVALGMAGFFGSGCNVQWTSNGTITMQRNGQPISCQPEVVQPACEPTYYETPACQPVYQPVCQPTVIQPCHPVEIRTECRPTITVRPLVLNAPRPVKAVARYLRR